MNKNKIKDNKVAVLQDQLARALADYDNFRKRTEREREQLGGILKSQMLSRLLPAMDMLMETQKHLQDAGLAMTIQEFSKSFKEEGIEMINAEKGTAFDETMHEVVETVEDKGMENGQIVDQILNGWRLTEGQVIRPAKVIVNKTN